MSRTAMRVITLWLPGHGQLTGAPLQGLLCTTESFLVDWASLEL